MADRPPINHQIKGKKVRVVDDDGENLGVMSKKEALQKAKEKDVDLVLVTGKPDIPVCKLIEVGKFMYRREKKKKNSKSKSTELKGVRLGFSISEHDMKTKVRRAKKFLDNDNKVKIELLMRGREKALADHAKEKIQDFLDLLEEETSFKVEKELDKQGSKFVMIVS
ncbi:MAG: translation initiation factor IF-3 [Candidatus Paceibacterota bacterium]